MIILRQNHFNKSEPHFKSGWVGVVYIRKWWHRWRKPRHQVHVDADEGLYHFDAEVEKLAPRLTVNGIVVAEWIQEQLRQRSEYYVNWTASDMRRTMTLLVTPKHPMITVRLPTKKEAMLFKLTFGGRYDYLDV